MRRHARGSSAGSIASADRRWQICGLVATGVFALLLFGAPAAQAERGVIGFFGNATTSSDPTGGGFGRPDGIAVNVPGAGAAEPGDVYVASGGSRIQQFSADGEFIRGWGRNVVQNNEVQIIEAPQASGGETFTLTYEGETTAPITISSSFFGTRNAIRSALAALPSIGSGNVEVEFPSGGSPTEGPWSVVFIGALQGTDLPAIVASTGIVVTQHLDGFGGSGLEATFEICDAAIFPVKRCQFGSSAGSGAGGEISSAEGVAVNQLTGDVYVVEEDRRRVQQFDAEGNFIRAWGRDVIVNSGTPPNSNGTGFEKCDTTTSPPNALSDCKNGLGGTEGGALSSGFGSYMAASPPATAPNAGNVLIADAGNGRVQEFTSEGDFVRAFGWDVIKPGEPGNDPNSERQSVTIAAIGGSFTLTFAGKTTSPISHDATPTAVEAALEALSTIDDVSVTDGPGDTSGSTPYVVEFLGALSDRDVNRMSSNGSQLVHPVGKTMACAVADPLIEPNPALNHKVTEYQWLRNGVPIPGATSSTYELTAADSGALVQCQTFSLTEDTGGTQASVPAVIVGAAPAVAPPVPPSAMPLPSLNFESGDSLAVGSAGGVELTCNSGSWSGSPSFSFRWYRNGVAIPGANSKTHVMTSADVATPAIFQCAVTGTNASGSVTRMSPFGSGFNSVKTVPAPEFLARPVAEVSPFSEVETQVPGANFEVCTAIASCQAGPPIERASNFVPVGEPPAGQFGRPGPITVDDAGAAYVADDLPALRVQKFTPVGESPGLAPSVFGGPGAPAAEVRDDDDGPRGIAIGAGGNVLVLKSFITWNSGPDCGASPPGIELREESRVLEMSSDGSTVLDTLLECSGAPGEALEELTANPSSGRTYVTVRSWPASSGGPAMKGGVLVLGEVEPPTILLDPLEPTTNSLTVTGAINPRSGTYRNPPAVEYYVEHRPAGTSKWTRNLTPLPLGAGNAAIPFSTTIYPLLPNSDYEVRVIAYKEFASGVAVSAPESFTTKQARPSIKSVRALNVRADSTDLEATISPQGSATSYWFEYGTTPGYGTKAPIDPGTLGAGQKPVTVTQHIEGLSAITYHFRVVAENGGGVTRSPNQTLNFYPPVCPNGRLRQQTSASYLPDCRAYEIASPENAGGSILFPWAGPHSAHATSPSRISFVGVFGGLPDSGEFLNTNFGDAYVSTRTDRGWQVRYVGLGRKEAFLEGGPPVGRRQGRSAHTHSQVPTNPDMSRFVIWNHGADLADTPGLSLAPHVFDVSGDRLGRLPTNLATVANGEDFIGEVKMSKDLGHFVFTSDIPFAPDGQPGDIYDNDIGAGTIEIVSRDPEGAAFTGSPVALSDDGARILMSSVAYPFCEAATGFACAPNVPASEFFMRAGGITYDVTKGHKARFAGMSGDGSSVYFTSNAQITTDDTDGSADLFAWNEATDSVTRVSAGSEGLGDSDSCVPDDGWTSDCDIELISEFERSCFIVWCSHEPHFFHRYSKLVGGVGGNGLTDNFVSASGDIYFFSPEQLTGAEGVNGRANLFVYRNGSLRFVASMDGDSLCQATGRSPSEVCTESSIARMQVTRDGGHAAFITRDRLTAFDNAGQAVMYRYDAHSGELICVSCPQRDVALRDDVEGSQNGLFMADDGRVFFSTDDPIAPSDTNEVLDVYEYVDGRAQLITDGTSPSFEPPGLGTAEFLQPGLIGVSANGTDVYFATRATLTPQDKNGGNLKVYDARTNGGFPFEPPPVQCNAADECHSGSNAPPPPVAHGTAASLGNGGNVSPKPRRCAAKSKRARRAARRAKLVRRRAARSKGTAGKKLRARARRFGRIAIRNSRKAKGCRKRQNRTRSSKGVRK